MNKEIKVDNLEQFQERVDKKDFKIAQIIVDSILNNLDSKKTNIHIISVSCMEDDTIYDLSLERKYFVETLQENLKYFVENEQYEKCASIVEAINILQSKNETKN